MDVMEFMNGYRKAQQEENDYTDDYARDDDTVEDDYYYPSTKAHYKYHYDEYDD